MDVKNCVDRWVKVNGSTGRHDQHLGELQEELAERGAAVVKTGPRI